MKVRLPVVESVGALVAFCILVFIALERQGQDTGIPYDTYSTYDARSGGYRAWYELLQREGLAPGRFQALPAYLDEGTGTLILADPLPFSGVHMNDADAISLAAWVKRGGRLILLGRGPVSHALEDVYPVPRYAAHPARRADVIIAPELRALGVRSVGTATAARFLPTKRFQVLVSDARGPIVLRHRSGRGQTIFVSDEGLFTNRQIGRFDRARLAYALAGDAKGRIAFDEALHGYGIPEHWWQIMPRPLLAALAISLAVLTVAAVGAAIRLGPPLVPQRRREPTSSEYIDAVAALYERARAAHASLLTAYVSTRRILARALSIPDDTSDGDLEQRLPDERTRGAFVELRELTRVAHPAQTSLVRGASLAYELRKEANRVIR